MSSKELLFGRRSFAAGVGGLSFAGMQASTRTRRPTRRWHQSIPPSDTLIPTAVDDQRLYATNGGAAVAFDATDGTRQWRYDAIEATVPQAGIGERNVYAVARNGAGFAALEPETGAERWRSPVPGLPLIDRQTVFAVDETLHAYSADEGTKRWTATVGESTGMAVTSDAVFVGGRGGTYSILRADGSERWQYTPSEGNAGGRLYPVHADATASRVLVWEDRTTSLRSLHTDDASEVWQYTFDASTELFRGTVTETLAVAVEGREVVAVDRSDGTERWRFTADEPLAPHVLEIGDGFVVRGDHRAYGIAAVDGARRWSISTEGIIETAEGDESVALVTAVRNGTGKRLVRVSGRDGSVEWKEEWATGELHALSVDDRVYVGTDGGLSHLVTGPSGLGGPGRLDSGLPFAILGGGLTLVGALAGARRYLDCK